MLKVNEIFFSIQGESTHAGRPCVFVRLTGCNLRCTYCDTEYAFYEGREMSLDDILEQVQGYGCQWVEVTGGEPLMQAGVHDLMRRLIDEGYRVMLETGGSLDLGQVPPEVFKIVDFKTPSSGMESKNRWEIVGQLQPHDEIKFVVGDRPDFDWAVAKIQEHRLATGHTVLFSPTFGKLSPRDLANWVMQELPEARLQLQLHKVIWSPDLRGV